MRVECVKCHCRFDISNREVLAMAAKLQAKGKLPPAYSAPAPVANGNVRADNATLEAESIALRFAKDAKPPVKPPPLEPLIIKEGDTGR